MFKRAHFVDGKYRQFSHFTKWGLNLGHTTFTSPSTNNFAEFYCDLQCTGIKDKTGRYIYDGDVLKNSQAEVNIVHWFWDGWHYQNYHAESLPLGDHGNPYINDGITTHEIIGNIYENPEYLKTVYTNG